MHLDHGPKPWIMSEDARSTRAANPEDGARIIAALMQTAQMKKLAEVIQGEVGMICISTLSRFSPDQGCIAVVGNFTEAGLQAHQGIVPRFFANLPIVYVSAKMSVKEEYTNNPNLHGYMEMQWSS